MNDTMLLMTGVIVFSLMLIAMVLTVLEFRNLKGRRGKHNSGDTRSEK